MKLLTKDIERQLLRNGHIRAQYEKDPGISPDFIPVVKLFTPDANCTWLLTDVDPEGPDMAYGLCDLGMGFPECGPVCLSDIRSVRGSLGLLVERDKYFTATHTLSVYARAARNAGGITEDCDALAQATRKEGVS